MFVVFGIINLGHVSSSDCLLINSVGHQRNYSRYVTCMLTEFITLVIMAGEAPKADPSRFTYDGVYCVGGQTERCNRACET